MLGIDSWRIEPTPEKLIQSLSDFDKEKTAILDLVCGDGGDCITLVSSPITLLLIFAPMPKYYRGDGKQNPR